MHFWLLDKQPVAENDWLLDVLSEGGRTKLRCASKVLSSPDWHVLYHVDVKSKPNSGAYDQIVWVHQHSVTPLEGEPLYCACYLTELLSRLLSFDEPCRALVNHYQSTLVALADAQYPEPWLRLFEYQLLQHLGYGFSWQHDGDGRVIDAQKTYVFDPASGFMPAHAEQDLLTGADILACASFDSRADGPWRLAKRVLRRALDQVLSQHRQVLHSRTLIAQSRS